MNNERYCSECHNKLEPEEEASYGRLCEDCWAVMSQRWCSGVSSGGIEVKSYRPSYSLSEVDR